MAPFQHSLAVKKGRLLCVNYLAYIGKVIWSALNLSYPRNLSQEFIFVAESTLKFFIHMCAILIQSFNLLTFYSTHA